MAKWNTAQQYHKYCGNTFIDVQTVTKCICLEMQTNNLQLHLL